MTGWPGLTTNLNRLVYVPDQFDRLVWIWYKIRPVGPASPPRSTGWPGIGTNFDRLASRSPSGGESHPPGRPLKARTTPPSGRPPVDFCPFFLPKNRCSSRSNFTSLHFWTGKKPKQGRWYHMEEKKTAQRKLGASPNRLPGC